MRLSLKYPAERLPLSWNFVRELNGHAVKEFAVTAVLDPGSRTADPDVEMLDALPWLEDGVLFQLVQGGIAGADYRFVARVTRDDGLIYQKVSVLPVREA